MLVVDRILSGLAVCVEDGATIEIPLSKISGAVHEGDVLLAAENGTGYTIDSCETQKRHSAISERFERIKRRNK